MELLLADVRLGLFSTHPLHANHFLGLMCEQQMMGACHHKVRASESVVPGSELALIPSMVYNVRGLIQPQKLTQGVRVDPHLYI